MAGTGYQLRQRRIEPSQIGRDDRWLLAGGILPLAALAIFLIGAYPAVVAVTVAAVIVAAMTVYGEVESRRQAREAVGA